MTARRRRAWGPTRYGYVPGFRLRVNVAPDVELPASPSTAWVGLGDKALRVEVTVVDRSEAPWGQRS